MKTLKTKRSPAGFSLLEVLIALLIMLIGVTSVIALFPVAVMRIRQSVLDTRCTFVARSMWDVVDLKEMTDDPLHKLPTPPAAPDNFLQPPFDDSNVDDAFFNSFYLNIVPFDADSNADFNSGVMNAPPAPANPPTNPSATRLQWNCERGVPILIDPLWVESDKARGVNLNAPDWDPRRQTVAFFPNRAPFDSIGLQPHPLRVVTTAEAASIRDESPLQGGRQAYLRHWFTSTGDVQYREDSPAIPFAPSAADVTSAGGATEFPLAPGVTTSQRSYPYSWALLIQRPVARNTDPDAAAENQPPILSAEMPKERLLVFYRRNLADPYVPAIGSFVDGDNRVTLRYEQGRKPMLRRGGWLLELTIEGNLGEQAGPPVVPEDRRQFNFHRIADYDDAIQDGQPVISVTLETEPTGYGNFGARPVGVFPDPAPGAPGAPQYFPVLVLDGLQEVFGRPTF